MLTHLRIRNLALVADLTLELQAGFNAITGETGAGKSMLIGALNLLLGQRADRNLLRAGAEACTVEAVFEIGRIKAPVAAFLAEHGYEVGEETQLLLKRSFTAAGTNRQFINGSPATLQALAELGEWLVDIHGPHEHQSLFHAARQLALLDAYGELQGRREAVGALFDRCRELEDEKAALVVDEATYAREVDLLRHQCSEIGAARLQPGEDVQLEGDHRRLQHAARLTELIQGALDAVAEGEDTVVSRMAVVGRAISDMARLDEGAGDLADLHTSATEALAELRGALSTYAERIDLDPGRLQEVEERLNLLHSLRRKYGSTVEAILEFGVQAREKLERLEGRDAELQRLNSALESAGRELKQAGAELTAARRKAIPKLAKAVSTQLKDLGFARSEFTVDLKPGSAPRRDGFDAVEFQFAPNPGEPPRPLRDIASSGELARVMLALKTVLAAQDDVPVVVFDEVDANIGGETAHAVGAKMREIGRRRQVLCITHLAPVAAAGDVHFVVNKATRDGRTTTQISSVAGGERIDELARMLGGGAAARQHAAALCPA